MKIIQNNAPRKWYVVCDSCNSILEYIKEDVISKESNFFYLYYIKCPCCGENIDVKHW